MSLLQSIKTHSLEARKRRDNIASSFLTTLLSEASFPGLNDGKRDSTDEEVVAVVRKFLKNNAEVLLVRPNDTVALTEKALLEQYLPKQLSDEELRAALIAVAREAGVMPPSQKDMGVLMKGLKEHYSGQYDGKAAQQAVAHLIAHG